MNLKQLRRTVMPRGFGVKARRRWRDRLLRRLGLERSYKPLALVTEPHLVGGSLLPMVMADFLLRYNNLTFMQIGAFDGVKNDDLFEFICRHRLRGVLVEPQPRAFAALARNYRDQPQLKLLNVAISADVGSRPLYIPRRGTSTVASFDRGHLLRHGLAGEDIVAHTVNCMPVAAALQAAGFDQVDLLQIDAEGYDYEILRTIDFSQLRPAIVRYEYRHLSQDDADRAVHLLAAHGYRFFVEQRDIVAYRPRAVLAGGAAA